MIKNISLMLFTVAIASRCFAQSADYVVTPDNLPDPVVTNFVGNNYSVDLFTGIGNVNIPIYSYSIDGLDLSISLNYNTKGIKVDEIASPVGLGWDLQVGGYMLRTTNGIEDELDVPASGNNLELFGYWVYPPTFPTAPYIRESEEDYYDYSFGGRYIRNSHAVFNPKSEISFEGISPITIGGMTFPARKVVDEKGNKFEFSHVAYMRRIYNDQEIYVPYKWYLTKVTTYSGQVINYTYTDYDMNYSDYMDQLISEGKTSSSGAWLLDSVIDSAHVWKGIVSQLTEIDYPNGDIVTFNMNFTHDRCDLNNRYYLDNIAISNYYDSYVGNTLTYKFNYAYFNANTSGDAELPITTSCGSSPSLDLRLKLKGIDKMGSDFTTVEPYYTFDYNSTRLPPRLSPKQDWFGYYNGKSPTTLSFTGASGTLSYSDLSIPYQSIWVGSSTNFGENRSSDINYLKACVLTTMTNGLGGTTTFNYDAHTLSNEPSSSSWYTAPSDFDATSAYDGLKLNSITYSDKYNIDNACNTNFTYSDGYRFYTGGYFWYPLYYASDPTTGGYLAKRRYYNHFVVPFDMLRNSNHGYSTVSVTTQGSSSNTVAKSTYHFTNIVDDAGHSRLMDDKTKNYYAAFPRSRMNQSDMGLLYKLEKYSPSTILLSKDSIIYDSSAVSIASNRRYVSYSYWNGTDYDTVSISRDYQPFQPSLRRVSKKISTSYSNGNSVTHETSYSYDGADNITDIKWTDSKGYYNDVFFWYNYNITTSTMPIITFFMDGYQHVVAKYFYQNKSASTSSFDTLIGYEAYQPHLDTNNFITFPKYFYSIDTKPFVGSSERDAILYGTESGNLKEISATTKYDDHNNPLETKIMGLEHYNTTLWTTELEQKIATVSNAKYNEVAYTSFEGTFEGLSVSDYNKGNWDFDPSNIQLGNTMTGHYYYDLGSGGSNYIKTTNILTGSKKYLLSFWCNGHAPATKLKNPPAVVSITLTNQVTVGDWTLYTATFNATSADYVELDPPVGGTTCYIDELRLCPADASMTTYTYEPLFGVSSISDERNNIIYQMYDAFGRKKATKDINGNIIDLTTHSIQGVD